MRIIVDADATPSIKLIEEVALNNCLKCVLISDDSHNLYSDYSEVIIVSRGTDSVDFYIANYIEKNDIIITQDYGVGCTALAKNCFAIDPKGNQYTNDNIDILLMNKHFNMKNRKHIKLKGPKKRSREDDFKLIDTLLRIIKENR